MSFRNLNRSDTANGPWSSNQNVNDGQEKYYIFKYECPECGVIAKTRLPLKNYRLDAAWFVECGECGHKSSPAINKTNIIEIYRCLEENVSESELKEHNAKVFIDAVSACAAIIINADNVVKREEIREYKEFCLAFFSDNFDYSRDRLKFYLANTNKAYGVIGKLKNAKNELKNLLLELLRTACLRHV